jgi:hypothetical protein
MHLLNQQPQEILPALWELATSPLSLIALAASSSQPSETASSLQAPVWELQVDLALTNEELVDF